MAAGAAIGTATGIPVIGTIGGIIIGFSVAVIGSLLGSGSKKLVMQQRATETKRQIAPHIDEICENIRKELKKGFEAMCNGVVDKLQSISIDRKTQIQKKREEAVTMLKNQNNAEKKLEELSMDLAYLLNEEDTYYDVF